MCIGDAMYNCHTDRKKGSIISYLTCGTILTYYNDFRESESKSIKL